MDYKLWITTRKTQDLRCRSSRLLFDLGRLVHQNIPQRNQSFQFLAFDDGEMTESEFTHDEEALFDALVGRDGARVRSHNFRNGGGARRAADGDYAVHNVAFGEDASKISVAENGQGANIVLQHVARGFEHGAVGIDGVESAVFYQLAESRHQLVLGEGESHDAAGPTADLK